ncbi:CoA ester lyase [Caenibius sp. WL]|uniref:HpcH/HpaI aldolase/citrate lyase family protein n=1 Tax=Caenibius sp. WL TaxID=2872646 RepID=UPI001C998191|nr:CoA ester lyase [Caenibius sp. WL]QZP09035.1 CoA ester lyase [Caenibius sp. WL]
MADTEPLRRSMLYLAGAYPEMLGIYPRFPADLFCFDLEDGTPPADKVAARERIAEVLRTIPDGAGRERLLRVNGLDTPWGHDDCTAAAQMPLSGVLVPKVEGAGMVRQVEAILNAAGAPQDMRIWCLIETPLGVLRAEEIATASPRVAGLVIGGTDLAETLHVRQTPDRLGVLYALSHTVLVARAHGLAVIDAVHPNYANTDGFAESCAQGVEWGFDGKSVVLPATIAAANAAFGPSEDEIAHARAQVAAAGEAQDGYASLHLAHARRLLAKADHIARQDALRAAL